MCHCLWSSEEGVRTPEMQLQISVSLGPPREQTVLLTAEVFLQPPVSFEQESKQAIVRIGENGLPQLYHVWSLN